MYREKCMEKWDIENKTSGSIFDFRNGFYGKFWSRKRYNITNFGIVNFAPLCPTCRPSILEPCLIYSHDIRFPIMWDEVLLATRSATLLPPDLYPFFQLLKFPKVIPRSSAVICGPLRSFAVICGPLRSFAVISRTHMREVRVYGRIFVCERVLRLEESYYMVGRGVSSSIVKHFNSQQKQHWYYIICKWPGGGNY